MDCFPGLPPFPEDVVTHPLVVVDYLKIKAGDQEEIDKLYNAATGLGFWYLKNHGIDEAEEIFNIGADTMALPLEEKMKYSESGGDNVFGYKAAGVCVIDEKGNTDIIEMLNVAKDDVIAWPGEVYQGYPKPATDRMDDILKPFVRKTVEVNHTLLDALSVKLGLPKDALSRRHRLDARSTCGVRCIKTPPEPEGWSEEKALFAAHSDYGSITFLHNRLGGMQVLAPGTNQWQYVKPLPGHAILNVGDSLNLLSGGLLRSNLHRVVPPPGQQFLHERWTVGYFMRPENDVTLNALVDESPLIAEAVAKQPERNFRSGETARQWSIRRFNNIRAANYKGKENWKASGGTENYKAVREAVDAGAGARVPVAA